MERKSTNVFSTWISKKCCRSAILLFLLIVLSVSNAVATDYYIRISDVDITVPCNNAYGWKSIITSEPSIDNRVVNEAQQFYTTVTVWARLERAVKDPSNNGISGNWEYVDNLPVCE